MADYVRGNEEVKFTFPSGFAEKVHRDWAKSASPEKIISYKYTEGVLILSDGDLRRRVTDRCVVFNWTFEILTKGKELQRIALTLEQSCNNFTIKSVSKNNEQIGITNGQEWYNDRRSMTNGRKWYNGQINATKSCEWYDTESDKYLDRRNENERIQYFIKICFVGHEYGTYRQNVIFGFEEYPVILKELCMDCLPKEDILRIYEATKYQLSQNPERWTDDKLLIIRFESPFVLAMNSKEAKLSMIYPYPDKHSFFLTQETLTNDCLTLKNYRGRLHELISVEELARHEQIARYNEISCMRLLSHYVLFSSGDGSSVTKFAPPGELFAQLPVNRNISEDTKSGRLFLRGCNSVLFKSLAADSDLNIVFEAGIEDKCTQTVYIRLSKNCVDKLKLVVDTDLQVQVQFVLSRLSFCEWHRAVDTLPDVGLVFLSKKHQQLKESNIQDILDMDTSTFNRSWNWLILNPLLNAEQKKALTIMTAPIKISLPPILLLGPFGTGKTFMIAQALRILLIQSSEHKILLCTHSNSAADLYVKEFFNVWYKTESYSRLKPVRIYYKGRNSSTVHPVVQQYSLMDSNGKFRDPTEDDIKDCSLIITTLATSSSLTNLNLSPTHIVVDEAAQALECEVLIPLALATPKTRLILAGDQTQLAPEIYSDLANERGLGISLLERIYKKYPQNHPCRIHLCQNYRAHADIIKFTSEMFYDGMLKSGNSLLERHPVLKPLTFYAIPGEETQAMHSTGYIHATEAYELANRVLELKNSWPVHRWGPYSEGSIGVLSYYAEQVQRIRTELRKRKLFDVSVERVLNVQGKQFTAVFISIVRTRNCCTYSAEKNIKDYGFLTNPKLLNTAITRAKCLVAVVGDPIALLTIGSCRKLWQRYLEVADLHGIDRETLKYHLSLVRELPLSTPLNPLAREFVPRNHQSYRIEYLPVPMTYPVIHYSPIWPLR